MSVPSEELTVLAETLERALAGTKGAPPNSLTTTLEYFASMHSVVLPKLPIESITSHLAKCGPNDRVLDALALAIHAWDHQEGASWAGETAAHSDKRRAVILGRLGFSAAQQYVVNARIPRVTELDRPIVIATDHEAWYPEKAGGQSFYWSHYTAQLQEKWDPKEVELLGLSIDDVVARLSEPSRPAVLPVKGLVVGYVQSGKTAHFSGLIAKASDAGYRLIIVLAGTIDILRRQTQRRIDKEIVGRDLLTEEEYGGDAEWESFVSHGGRPSLIGAFDWDRLTNIDDDYRSMKRHLTQLEFKAQDRLKPFNDRANLRVASAKLAVVKKTPPRLKKLCDDLEGLKGLTQRLEHVPTLVIDDESDQASINTVDQQKPGNKGKRTGTNEQIRRLLRLLPRAQYVGYTATPFANVFIDADDAADLFPRDFIISLRRPKGYVGASDFYDFGTEFADGNYKGNRNAFVRPIKGANEELGNLPRAVDAFVVAGAIKLFRAHKEPKQYRFRHHTMLVHHSAAQLVHDADKRVVEKIFRNGARYQQPSGSAALEAVFNDDFAKVSAVRGEGAPFPKTFNDLKPFVSKCITKLCANRPVRIVNGAHKDDTPDFDAEEVWAILVGGTKLSRGYTVEGLTISYYRRPTGAGDTLMQMGRWFGFRHGYKDLVRLFLGDSEKRGKVTVDLYESFGAVCRDEEALRNDLRKYAAEGLKPWQVPPLVKQHLADLPPTSRSKMFNAEIRALDMAGDWTEKTQAPPDDAGMKRNLEAATDLVSAAEFQQRTKVEFTNAASEKRSFDASVGAVPGSAIVAFLQSYKWADDRNPIGLELDYIVGKLASGALEKWTLMVPQLGSRADTIALPVVGRVSLITRARVSDTRFGVYSEPRHVDAAKAIARVSEVKAPSKSFAQVCTGTPVLVLYLVLTRGQTDRKVSVGFGIQYPGIKQTTAIQWSVRQGDKSGEPVVPSSGSQSKTSPKRHKAKN